MKRIISIFYTIIFSFNLDAQVIIGAEYFFDNDPGAGQGTPIFFGGGATSVSFSATIPTNSLSAGFHSLAIRTKDATNIWGLYETRTVYISGISANEGVIDRAEYFIDADPGCGFGTPLSIGTSGNAVNFSTAISTSSLSPGFHSLVIRTRTDNGRWGLFEVRGFYLAGNPINTGAITAAEYFFDIDPGEGNGTSLDVPVAGNIISLSNMISIASLAPGFHNISIRTRNAEGLWGLFESRSFYIKQVPSDMGIVTAAEYFIDSDPGVGNGSPLTVSTPGNNVSQSYIINIPGSTSNGEHLLVIRTRDANGRWGLFEISEFLVDGNILPLRWLSFTGERKASFVSLEWRTTNEVNTSHFELERSKNGVDFSMIGRVDALGQQENRYDFDDMNPIKGVNFYRVKQVDRDGRMEYSTIIKVYFGTGINELKLSPQPVSTKLNIQFGGNGNTAFIQVFDAGGRMVINEKRANSPIMELKTVSLPKGVYYIVVSDGIEQQKGQFIKQ